MSDKKQSITLRETKSTYPGPGFRHPTFSWTLGKSNSPQSITLRPTRADPPPNWDILPRTQNIPLILINGIPLPDQPANTPAGKFWVPEEDEKGIEFTPSRATGIIKLRPDPPPFPGSGPASELSTGTTQDTPTSTGTPLPKTPPGFTEAHRGQATLYDCPLNQIPSEYPPCDPQSHGQLLGTPTDVYSSASDYLSRNDIPPPIRTTGLNPVANNFTPGASPMSGPLSPELARDKLYLDNQALTLWGCEWKQFELFLIHQPSAQVRENQETKDLAGQDSHESCQGIEDERDRIDAENDRFWDQVKQEPAPKPEPKE